MNKTMLYTEMGHKGTGQHIVGGNTAKINNKVA
jgi:hypothetical protein